MKNKTSLSLQKSLIINEISMGILRLFYELKYCVPLKTYTKFLIGWIGHDFPSFLNDMNN